MRAKVQQLQYAYELRMLLEGDRGRETKECLAMAREELISSVPPLTQPKPVRSVLKCIAFFLIIKISGPHRCIYVNV
jgi:hypothetical protein